MNEIDTLKNKLQLKLEQQQDPDSFMSQEVDEE